MTKNTGPNVTVNVSNDNFGAVTSREGLVLVDCWASWCRNCDEFAEHYRRAAAKHPKHLFAKLDTQEQKELRSALGIQHIPSLLLYRDGLLLFNQPGSYDEAALDDIIAQAESLDMDRVRAEMASEEGAPEG
jgi:thioredoxin 1